MSAIWSTIWERVKSIPERLGARGRLLVFLLIILVSVGYSVLVFTEKDPRSNSFCGTCHNMEPFIEAIEPTPHGAFNCHTCHELSPSVVKELWIQLTESPSAAEVKERSTVLLFEKCTECHKVTELTTMQIHEAHLSIVKKARSCNLCHNPHAEQELASSCTDCHDARSAATTHQGFHDMAIGELERGNTAICSQCHSFDAKWEIPLSPECITGFVKNYGCFDCHEPPLPAPSIVDRPCTECHSS